MKTIIVILLFIPFLAFSQDYEIGDNLKVAARSGLNVRNAPGVTGSKVGFLEYGQKVKVISKEFTSVREVYDNLEGGWVEIEKGKVRGFVFDGFLTKLPVVLRKEYKDTFLHCLNSELENYVLKNFIIKDTFEYSNGFDGGGAHGMTIFDLNNDHQFIRHLYYESQGLELQLENIRKCEGFIFVKSILENCNLFSPENDKELGQFRNFGKQLNDKEESGILSVHWLEDRMFFSFGFGP